MKWSLTSDDTNPITYASVAEDTGVLTITKENLPTEAKTATLTATVWRDSAATNTFKTVNLTFNKNATCNATPAITVQRTDGVVDKDKVTFTDGSD